MDDASASVVVETVVAGVDVRATVDGLIGLAAVVTPVTSAGSIGAVTTAAVGGPTWDDTPSSTPASIFPNSIVEK